MKTKPRETMDWDHYFMFMAQMVAQKSKDPNTQVGSVIVDDNHCIVGTGYNGMPKGCDDDAFPWGQDTSGIENNKYIFVCHSESNALDFSDPLRLKGSRIYCSLFPCNECAKRIIQNGIKEVIYLSDKYANLDTTIASKIMLNMAGIKYRQFIPQMKRLVLEL